MILPYHYDCRGDPRGSAGKQVLWGPPLQTAGQLAIYCPENASLMFVSLGPSMVLAHNRCSVNISSEFIACNYFGMVLFSFLSVHFTDGEVEAQGHRDGVGHTRVRPDSWLPSRTSSPTPYLGRLWSMPESHRKPPWIPTRESVLGISRNIPGRVQEASHWTWREAQRIESKDLGSCKFCNASPPQGRC